MKRRILKVVLTTLLVSFACATAASAQRVENGQLTGKIISGGADVTLTGVSVTILTVPVTGHFVVTQACAALNHRNEGSRPRIASSATGPIVAGSGFRVTNGGGGSYESCTLYSPGLSLQPGEVISCVPVTNGEAHCTVTGVLLDR